MPVQLNSINDIVNKGQGALKTLIPSIDPAVDGSFANSLLVGTGTQVFTEQKNITNLQKDFFPQTGGGEFLDFWGHTTKYKV